MKSISRIHHVSALGGNGTEIINFYRDVLRIPLIKATVNYAQGDAYHLFFASHGTESQGAMTYFDWRDRHAGKTGGGQGGRTAFQVPKSSLEEWNHNLTDHGVEVTETNLFGTATLEFTDPHGIPLAIVAGEKETADNEIFDFYGAELFSTDYKASGAHLEQVLGLKKEQETNTHFIYVTDSEDKHRLIIPKEDMQRRLLGQGTVDHLALEVADKEELDSWREHLDDLGIENRDLTNQNYRKATYYREPGHVRIELATSGLGAMVELESTGELGTEIVIPAHFKEKEQEILKNLPPLEL
jgi:glyoxalase family protein